MVKVGLHQKNQKVTEYCFTGDTYNEVSTISNDFCTKLKNTYQYARFNPNFHDHAWESRVVIVDSSDIYYGKIFLSAFLAIVFLVVAYISLHA